MYPGFPVSNILESTAQSLRSILYQPHYSVHDLCFLDMEISLHCIDNNANKFFDKNSTLVINNNDTLELKSYSVFVSNNPIFSMKHNTVSAMHLNSIFICHDHNLVNLKKEDRFLLCQNALKNNDQIYYHTKAMENFICPKVTMEYIKYCVPEILNNNKHEGNNKKIGLLCYNKELPSNYLSQITESNIDVTNLTKIPSSIQETNSVYSKYHAVVEIDTGSIINVLWAIKSGCIGIIIDNQNILHAYKNIPNLYIVDSIPQLSKILNNLPNYQDTEWPKEIFIGLDEFKQNMISTLTKTSQKAYLL